MFATICTVIALFRALERGCNAAVGAVRDPRAKGGFHPSSPRCRPGESQRGTLSPRAHSLAFKRFVRRKVEKEASPDAGSAEKEACELQEGPRGPEA